MAAAPHAVVLGCRGARLDPQEAAYFRDADPWGFILFARNVEDPRQLERLVGDLRHAVGRDAPVMIDQEGGRVQRMRAPHWREWPSPEAESRDEDVARAARRLWLRARLIAAELAAVGIDVDCIPTLDVARPETHPFLANRCFGTDPARVARLGRAVADGLMAGGVLPVMKHAPGHGRAAGDSHHDLPRIDAAPEALRAVDFAPFAALADLPMAMTAHLVYSAFDGARPATLSPRMIALIREEIGFGGLLLSDDISMEALSGGLRERTEAARMAGCDVVLHCTGSRAEMDAVLAGAGRLEGLAAARAAGVLAARCAALPVDIAALEAELEALRHDRGDG